MKFSLFFQFLRNVNLFFQFLRNVNLYIKNADFLLFLRFYKMRTYYYLFLDSFFSFNLFLITSLLNSLKNNSSLNVFILFFTYFIKDSFSTVLGTALVI